MKKADSPAARGHVYAVLGLRQRILKAASLGELSILLNEGKHFVEASEKTVASWHRAAERRRKELQA